MQEWSDKYFLRKAVIKASQFLQLFSGIGYKRKGEITVGDQDDHPLPIYRWYFILESVIKKYGEEVAKDERDALAWALWQGKKLQDQGYDVFSGFSSFNDVRHYIEQCLLTYDFGFLRDIGTTKKIRMPYSRYHRKI